MATRAVKSAPLKLERPAWTTACPDWQERIVNSEPLIVNEPLFRGRAEQGLAIFDQLRIVDAGPDVTFGDSRPWIRQFAASIFGAYCNVEGHPDEGRQLIRKFFMLIPKKNSKSTTASGIMLTALILNWRPEAEYLILSPTKEVADNSFKPLRAAIEADEELSAMFIIRPAIRTIEHRITRATLKVVAADSSTVTGKKATGILIDELHEFGKSPKAENMLVEATGGLMSRPEGFVIFLTTQSAEPPAGVFKKELDYARAVRDGRLHDPSYLPVIYEFPERYLDRSTKLYMRPENWHIVNPNMGITVDAELLGQIIQKAGITGEDSIQSVVSKHLNVQIGLDLGADAWPGAALWEACAWESQAHLMDVMLPPHLAKLERLMEACEVITAGVDGGGLDDLLALTFTGRVKGTIDRYVSWSHCWASEVVLERRKDIATRLRDFEAQGDLTIVPSLGPDVAELASLVKRVDDRGLLEALGIDPARIASLRTALSDAGLPVDDEKWFIKVRQGWSLCSAMWWVERGLATGNYMHMNQALVDWSVSNAKVVARANSLLVTKELSGSAKIDVVMSSFCAAELMSYNPASRSGGYSLANLTLMG